MYNEFPKLASLAGIAGATLALSFSAAVAADDAELEQVRAKVAEMFEMIEPGDVYVSPVDGWYTIQKGSIVAYISGDGRYLLQGDLIDLDQQKNLSEVARNDARRELMANLDEQEVITFSPAKVQYRVSVFTDVECTYCRRLHSQIDEYLAHGIEVRYLLYPRNGPASRAWSTSEDVWCAKDRNRALTMAKLDKQFESSTCDSSIVQQHYVMGRDVGLTGTPAIVLDDGTLISGYLPPDQLKARLDQLAAD
ncbi:MAG: thioredoxin fold domain-containing protein [Woeseiaceae bacterium]|nr:thioredoxin fold domain-containing protein [Woeseiaceae bacterium]